ncbi:hypothetical protein J6590_037684, partial [Homalodisca vitripennis]
SSPESTIGWNTSGVFANKTSGRDAQTDGRTGVVVNRLHVEGCGIDCRAHSLASEIKDTSDMQAEREARPCVELGETALAKILPSTNKVVLALSHG